MRSSIRLREAMMARAGLVHSKGAGFLFHSRMNEAMCSRNAFFDGKSLVLSDCFRGCRKALDLIQPRRAGGRVVELHQGVLCEPSSNIGSRAGYPTHPREIIPKGILRRSVKRPKMGVID